MRIHAWAAVRGVELAHKQEGLAALGGAARLAQAVGREEVRARQHEHDARGLVNVSLEVIEVLEVVHVEEAPRPREHPLQLPVHAVGDRLAGGPLVAQEGVEARALGERECGHAVAGDEEELLAAVAPARVRHAEGGRAQGGAERSGEHRRAIVGLR